MRREGFGARRRLPAQAPLIALALLLFLGGLLVLGLSSHGALAQPGAANVPHPNGTTPPTDPATPTNTATATNTATTGVTATATRAPRTATPSGSNGSEPTRVSLGQPTVGSSGGSDPALAPSSMGSSGLMIATIVGCVTGVLGVIVAAISLTILLRGGYGPFLRALLRRQRGGQGRRRGATTRRFADDNDRRGVAGAYAGNGHRGAPSRRPASPRGR